MIPIILTILIEFCEYAKAAITKLHSPETGSPLELKSVEKVEGNEIVEGTLCDQTGHRKYLIHNAIPRFVKGDNHI